MRLFFLGLVKGYPYLVVVVVVEETYTEWYYEYMLKSVSKLLLSHSAGIECSLETRILESTLVTLKHNITETLFI